ncbi:transposase, partial [Paenibacillus dendritiformis]|uniref:transposase n=1 Tax=Paenibacillus dendritiformis TaxID=130049 RepID=UPI000DB5A0A5
VKTKLKTKVPQLVEALNGQLRRHHRVMMRAHWKHLLFEEAELQEIESLIDEQLEPYRKEIECLDSIPGIDKSCASAIFAEMGPDIATRFPTVEQFTSWAGVSPGNHESAGAQEKPEMPAREQVSETQHNASGMGKLQVKESNR